MSIYHEDGSQFCNYYLHFSNTDVLDYGRDMTHQIFHAEWQLTMTMNVATVSSERQRKWNFSLLQWRTGYSLGRLVILFAAILRQTTICRKSTIWKRYTSGTWMLEDHSASSFQFAMTEHFRSWWSRSHCGRTRLPQWRTISTNNFRGRKVWRVTFLT